MREYLSNRLKDIAWVFRRIFSPNTGSIHRDTPASTPARTPANNAQEIPSTENFKYKPSELVAFHIDPAHPEHAWADLQKKIPILSDWGG